MDEGKIPGMKILHVTEPFASGIATFLEHLVSNLPDHQHIILHGERVSAEQEKKIKSRFPPTTQFLSWKYAQREINPWRDLRALFKLRSALRSARYDVVHLHSSKAGFLGRLACLWLGIRVVIYTPHAAAFLRTDVSMSKRKFYEFLETLGSTMPGVIVSCCKTEQNKFEQLSIKTRCVNNGTAIVDVTRSDSKQFIVCSSGLLTTQKNPAFFNKIVEHFNDRSDVRFIWMGDGELRDALGAQNVEVTGWIDRKVMNEYLGVAKIYLSTSSWEGLPYAVLEAMNAGCCLLLTRTGGHLDLVTTNGSLFNRAEEAITFIEQCLESPSMTELMGSNSKQLCATQFNAVGMAQQYNAIYYESEFSGR